MVFSHWRSIQSPPNSDSGFSREIWRHTEIVITVEKKPPSMNDASGLGPNSHSFWVHDDQSSIAQGTRAAPFRSINFSWPPKLAIVHQHKKKIILPVAAALILIIILGAVLGSQHGHAGTRKTTESSADDVDPGDQHNDGKDGAGKGSTLSVHQDSQLATVMAETSGGKTRILIFQDASGKLAVMEWHTELDEVYLLHKRMQGALPSMPMPGSPIFLLLSSPQNDLHLMYLNKTRHPVHLVQVASQNPPRSWAVMPFSLGQGHKLLPTTKEMRASAALIAPKQARRATRTDPGDMALVYQIEGKEPTFAFLTSSDPAAKEWSASNFTAKQKSVDMAMASGSPGLLVVPRSSKRSDDKGKKSQNQLLTVMWDHSAEEGPAALAAMDCQVGGSKGDACSRITATWADEKHHEVFLNARKPLRISKMTTSSAASKDDGRFVISSLDGNGSYRELLWDGGVWTGFRAFSAGSGASYKFSSVAATDPEVLFGVSDGKILRFERARPWWTKGSDGEDGWRLVGEMKPTVTDG